MKHLTDNELLRQTKSLVQKERELLTEVLAHLREISDRKLFAELGYKSLFEFAVKHLGYSEDQSYRRIAAMKLVQQVPGLEEKIQTGEVHLSHIGIAQNLFRQEAKAAKPFSTAQKQEVFSKIAGTSAREAEKITLKMSSKPEFLVPEKVKSVSDTAVSIQITINNETLQKIEILKGWLAHKHPGMTTRELFEILCEMGIKDFDPSKPVRIKSGPGKSPESKSSKNYAGFQKQKIEEKTVENEVSDACASSSNDKMNTNKRTPPEASIQSTVNVPKESPRSISASLRRQVFANANNHCEKCQSVQFLEIDHRTPIALGGTNDPENLRLLCRDCNQRAAINAFGKEKIISNYSYEKSFSSHSGVDIKLHCQIR